MDYGLFRRFEKLEPAERYPRTTLERGLFLVELEFASEGATRSVPVTCEMERSGFGEVLRLHVPQTSQHLSPEALQKLVAQLRQAQPPIQVHHGSSPDRLSFEFVSGEAQQRASVPGALIFKPSGELATLVVRLRG